MWSRILRALLVPWERYGLYDGGYDWVGVWSGAGVFEPHEYLAKQEYLQGLRNVIGELAKERNVVLHGHGSHLLLPSNVPALRVFVNASETARRDRIAAKERLSLKNAERWLSRADRESLAIFRDLFGVELLDMGRYDLTLNLDRFSFETAAQTVVGALDGRVHDRAPVELLV
ncbi:MAG: AAA family ATPase [Dehalococcoidia bacterium]